jgi:hypothetical protein
MDQRERGVDLEEAVRVAMDGLKSGLWVAVPCLVESYDETQMTVTCQPVIKVSLRSADGTFTWGPLPLMVDVPVVFPSGGGYAITWPLNEGDEVLVVIASRCVDNWWANGGVQLPAELRPDDFLSDGFALPGPRSQPRVLSGVSTTNLQIRTEDGTCVLELAPGGVINLKAPGGVNIMGNLVVTGTIEATEEITAVTTTLHAHVHGGVQTGGSETGVPIP